MNCEACREALSARIDGEAEPLPPEDVDRHVESCPACRSWFARAQRMRRAMSVRSAPSVPDLTDAILERTPAPSGEGWPARIGLGVVAIAQLGLALGQLLGNSHGHLDHEGAAWNLAIGIGFLWAALRTKAASGQLPLLTGFVLVLTVLSAGDLLGAAVTAGRLLSHSLVVIGLILLYVVHRQHRDRHHPGSSDSAGPGDDVEVTGERAPSVSRGPGPNRFRRPASRHRAA